MMNDSRPWTNPTRDLARSRMEEVPNIHRVHVAIVSGREDVHVLQFEDADREQMMRDTVPTFVRETDAVSVIVSSPASCGERDAAIVALLDRSIETFYVPIVRIVNAQPLIGDFRPATVDDGNRYGPILDELIANRIKHGSRGD